MESSLISYSLTLKFLFKNGLVDLNFQSIWNDFINYLENIEDSNNDQHPFLIKIKMSAEEFENSIKELMKEDLLKICKNNSIPEPLKQILEQNKGTRSRVIEIFRSKNIIGNKILYENQELSFLTHIGKFFI